MNHADFVRNIAGWLVRGGPYLPAGHRPAVGHRIPEDFVGMCVASSPDPTCDDYVIDRCNEMGFRQVRVDYTFGSGENHTARFLERLLDDSFRVLLHLVQPLEEAKDIESQGSQDRWREFVSDTLDRWGDRIDAVEIGSTINRHKWAGYPTGAFMIAWRIAHDVAKERGVRLVGPNVTDFEPFYNVAYLAQMHRDDVLPEVQTTNLFAERAYEPEFYDHCVFGPRLARLFKFNTIKKARLLQKIGRWYAIPQTWSTHVAWSARRINRVLPNIEEKQADYLARYMILAAASGSLSRAYWGPMIGHREGLIDDGDDYYPDHRPHVALYDLAKGTVQDYQKRPALEAMRHFTRLIPGATYEGGAIATPDIQIHVFSDLERTTHACWTTNGHAADPTQWYDRAALAGAAWTDRDGRSMPEPPHLFTESPCYASWPVGEAPPVPRDDRAVMPSLVIHKPVRPHQGNGWRGMIDADSDADLALLLGAIDPERIEQTERHETLRDARNAVWRISDPINEGCSLVVKRARLNKLHKRITDRWKPAKARRSWNGACELARRGIPTPTPIAFFEREQRASLGVSYYLCRFQEGDSSVRTYFTAYARGAAQCGGFEESAFYAALIPFLLNMHKRGVYFRDLSAGNILVIEEPDGGISFSLIDTGRARFFNRKVTMAQRLSDLKRICHPLHWEGRERFVGMYLDAIGETFTPRRKLPFRMYDLKHQVKRPIKRLRKRLLGRPVSRRSPAVERGR